MRKCNGAGGTTALLPNAPGGTAMPGVDPVQLTPSLEKGKPGGRVTLSKSQSPPRAAPKVTCPCAAPHSGLVYI